MTEDAWEGVRAAAADRASGAADIARRAAEALAALPAGDLEDAVATLVRGHPSMAPLWRLGSEVLVPADHAEAARAFVEALDGEREAVAAAAAPLLQGPAMVHSYSATVIAAVVAAGVPALCARSDPGGEGEATARRLRERGIEARVVEDAEALEAVASAGAVATGADAVGPGGVVNKVGTRRLAEEARAAGTPVLVLAGSSKLVAADLPAPEPFERVPWGSIDALVTGAGTLDPPEAVRRAAGFPLHPSLQTLLDRFGHSGGSGSRSGGGRWCPPA